jgi:hypothetical protein
LCIRRIFLAHFHMTSAAFERAFPMHRIGRRLKCTYSAYYKCLTIMIDATFLILFIKPVDEGVRG